MSMDMETKIKEALKDIDRFRTPECLDDSTIGRYAESSLAEPQQQAVETHLRTCLYCLKQLNDMTELLHSQKQPVPLSTRLAARLKEILPEADNVLPHNNLFSTIIQHLKEYFTFSPQLWRFSAIGLAAAWMVFLISTAVLRHEGGHSSVPRLNPDSFVKISALDQAGKVLREQRGVIVSSDGYIESNLQPLAGAYIIKVTLRDGRTREIRNIWKDEDTNLAVMKIDDNQLPEIPISEIENIKIGQTVFFKPDSDDEDTSSEAIVCDFKQTPGRRSSGGNQYIQIATQKVKKETGKIVDEKGNLVGFVITEEKNINLAAPASSFRQLVKTGKVTPISDLKQVSFSGDALNLYMKGILARDAQRWDEAIFHFQRAVKLNPRLSGAHLELGDLYYKKHQFDKEAQEYEAVLKVNPDNVDALYGLAWNKESFGKYKEATELYKKALALDPEDTDIL